MCEVSGPWRASGRASLLPDVAQGGGVAWFEIRSIGGRFPCSGAAVVAERIVETPRYHVPFRRSRESPCV